ncbi:MAG: hypothetical protein ACK4TA_16695 [Saprospiraceae bacterium]
MQTEAFKIYLVHYLLYEIFITIRFATSFNPPDKELIFKLSDKAHNLPMELYKVNENHAEINNLLAEVEADFTDPELKEWFLQIKERAFRRYNEMQNQ